MSIHRFYICMLTSLFGLICECRSPPHRKGASDSCNGVQSDTLLDLFSFSLFPCSAKGDPHLLHTAAFHVGTSGLPIGESCSLKPRVQAGAIAKGATSLQLDTCGSISCQARPIAGLGYCRRFLNLGRASFYSYFSQNVLAMMSAFG